MKKTRFYISILLITLLFSQSLYAKVTADEAKKARDAIAVVLQAKSGDPKALTAAIADLKNYPYKDVSDFCFALVEEEMKKPKPNSYVLNESLKTIAVISGKEESGRINGISMVAQRDLQGKIGASASFVMNEFQAAQKAVAGNPNPQKLPEPEAIADLIQDLAGKDKTVAAFAAVVGDDIINDKISSAEAKNEWVHIINREMETDAGFDVLVRIQGKVPVLIGEPGVGKTAIAEQIAYHIMHGNIPAGVYQKELTNAIVVQVTASAISRLAQSDGANAQAAAMEMFLKGVKKTEKELNRKIVVLIDEAHQLSTAQLDALKPYLMSREPVTMIWATTAKEFDTLRKDDAIMRRVEPILVEEFNPEITRDILRKTWVPKIEARYNVTITDEVLKNAVDMAKDYRPEVRRPSGPFLLLQDLALQSHRANKGNHSTPTALDLYTFLAKKMGVPVVPQDQMNFMKYMDDLKVKLKTQVISQDHLVESMVDSFAIALTSHSRHHAVVMVMGSTGVGKTYAAERIGEEFYGSSSRTLEIDMTAYQEGGYAKNKLFGAPNGVLSSDTDKGIICEFLDGRGKGGGIIILNEIEKAHPDILKGMMELFDKGEIAGGDGRIRKLGRSLIVMTSNKGASKLLPKEAFRGISREELNKMISKITQDDMKSAFVEKESYTATDGIPPEVMQRIDTFVYASPMLQEDAVRVAKIEIEKFIKQYERNGYGKLLVEPGFAEAMAASSYDEAFGVREIKRVVQSNLNHAVQKYIKHHGKADTIVIQASTLPHNPAASKVEVWDQKHKEKTLLSFDGPKLPVNNVMLDPVQRERLKTLEGNISSKLFGQDDAVKRVSDIVKAQAANPNSKSPATAFLIGLTGTGKTEMPKQLAEFRYGNKKAYTILKMGEIKHEYELNNIFSPPKGIVGSDSMGEFERFLVHNPNGGVIVFDEMSNAGGNDKAAKDAIAKRFYNILDEGEWTNPSGKTYNLKNYTIVFTGNDGQELFKGVSSDDMLAAIWKEHSSPDKTREILLRNGMPEAFMGRVKAVALMKPPSFEAKVKIAEKLMMEWKAQFTKAQPFEVKFSEDFSKELAKLMYSSKEGGRSIRNFIDSSLGSLAAQSMFDFDWNKLETEKGLITLSISSVSPFNPFYLLDPDKKSAILSVKATQGSKEIYAGEIDFTKEANFIKQIRTVDAIGTAFHEAGHAVANNPQISGQKLAFITIIPEDHYLGYARYEEIPLHTTNLDRKGLVHKVAIMQAGMVAEDMIGRPRNTGGGGDVSNIRNIITKTALEGSLVPELDGAVVNEKGIPNLSEKQKVALDAFIESVTNDAKEEAKKILTEKWTLVEAVAQDLIKSGNITGERFYELEKEIRLDPKAHANNLEKIKDALAKAEKGECSGYFKVTK